MLRRPFSEEDVEDVLAFAAERLATIEALHPRHSDEAPGQYIDRIAALSTLEDGVLTALGFIDGMAAALALDVDDLFWRNSGCPAGNETATAPA